MVAINVKQISRLVLIVGIGFGFHSSGYAISPADLAQELEGKQQLTIIDIRPNVLYSKNHIQNAINIPASIIDRKKLPALGRVVVYDDGIDIATLEQAVASLNAKPGIQAEPLEGGFSAWSSKNNVIQRETGLSGRQTRSLTYQMLQKMAERYDALLLIDLRMGTQQEPLYEHFPNVLVYDPIDTRQDDVANVKVSSYLLETIPKGNQKVLILIDDGNGFSEKVADKLHAAGTKRLAILTGGEQALRTRGEVTEEVRSSGG